MAAEQRRGAARFGVTTGTAADASQSAWGASLARSALDVHAYAQLGAHLCHGLGSHLKPLSVPPNRSLFEIYFQLLTSKPLSHGGTFG